MIELIVSEVDKTEPRFFEGRTLDDLYFYYPDLEGSLIFVKKEDNENYSLVSKAYEFLDGDKVKAFKY
ncbi:MAG TPA: hypothetical protein VJB35_06530 [Candidatus Nanoarchaeia archaeon]|nr:hypothetical protein [Candidatus Nanoarchaeia archaeon]